MLNLIPHRLGHFLIIKLHGAVGGDMGHRFVIPVFFLQPVPDSEAVPQMSIAQVIGFSGGMAGAAGSLCSAKRVKVPCRNAERFSKAVCRHLYIRSSCGVASHTGTIIW